MSFSLKGKRDSAIAQMVFGCALAIFSIIDVATRRYMFQAFDGLLISSVLIGVWAFSTGLIGVVGISMERKTGHNIEPLLVMAGIYFGFTVVSFCWNGVLAFMTMYCMAVNSGGATSYASRTTLTSLVLIMAVAECVACIFGLKSIYYDLFSMPTALHKEVFRQPSSSNDTELSKDGIPLLKPLEEKTSGFVSKIPSLE